MFVAWIKSLEAQQHCMVLRCMLVICSFKWPTQTRTQYRPPPSCLCSLSLKIYQWQQNINAAGIIARCIHHMEAPSTSSSHISTKDIGLPFNARHNMSFTEDWQWQSDSINDTQMILLQEKIGKGYRPKSIWMRVKADHIWEHQEWCIVASYPTWNSKLQLR